jgi:hypothetical protein
MRLPFKAARKDFADHQAWEAAARALGFTIEMHADVENGPSADDVFETSWALNPEGEIMGWCSAEPVDWNDATNTYTELETKAVLYDTHAEAYAALNDDGEGLDWVAKVAKLFKNRTSFTIKAVEDDCRCVSCGEQMDWSKDTDRHDTCPSCRDKEKKNHRSSLAKPSVAGKMKAIWEFVMQHQDGDVFTSEELLGKVGQEGMDYLINAEDLKPLENGSFELSKNPEDFPDEEEEAVASVTAASVSPLTLAQELANGLSLTEDERKTEYGTEGLLLIAKRLVEVLSSGVSSEASVDAEEDPRIDAFVNDWMMEYLGAGKPEGTGPTWEAEVAKAGEKFKQRIQEISVEIDADLNNGEFYMAASVKPEAENENQSKS